MIDISNVIVKKVRTAVTAVYQDAYVVSTNPDSISTYPCIAVVEYDNYTYERSLDNTAAEHHANVVYEINVYTNNADGKREQAKDIIKIVDTVMINNLFTRDLLRPMPNADRSVYRMYARYKGVVGSGETDALGNTIHQMYRR